MKNNQKNKFINYCLATLLVLFAITPSLSAMNDVVEEENPAHFLYNCNPDDQCPVCLGDLIPNWNELPEEEKEARDQLGLGKLTPWAMQLRCTHRGHTRCIYQWVHQYRRNTCPSCKRSIEDDVQTLCKPYIIMGTRALLEAVESTDIANVETVIAEIKKALEHGDLTGEQLFKLFNAPSSSSEGKSALMLTAWFNHNADAMRIVFSMAQEALEQEYLTHEQFYKVINYRDDNHWNTLQLAFRDGYETGDVFLDMTLKALLKGHLTGDQFFKIINNSDASFETILVKAVNEGRVKEVAPIITVAKEAEKKGFLTHSQFGEIINAHNQKNETPLKAVRQLNAYCNNRLLHQPCLVNICERYGKIEQMLVNVGAIE